MTAHRPKIKLQMIKRIVIQHRQAIRPHLLRVARSQVQQHHQHRKHRHKRISGMLQAMIQVSRLAGDAPDNVFCCWKRSEQYDCTLSLLSKGATKATQAARSGPVSAKERTKNIVCISNGMAQVIKRQK